MDRGRTAGGGIPAERPFQGSLGLKGETGAPTVGGSTPLFLPAQDP